MSAPAAKAFGEPVRTMAAMEESLSRREVQVLSSLIRGEKRALRALGLLRVTVAEQSCQLRVRHREKYRGFVLRATPGRGVLS